LVVVVAALIGAIVWNLLTWYLGLPSLSHALIGGLVGAGLASATAVRWNQVVNRVVVPMIVSPIVGFALAYLIMLSILWAFRRSNPHRVTRRFRTAQIVSASAMALGHGLQDAWESARPRRLSAVRWGVARNIVAAWILTIPMARPSRGWVIRWVT
jgi:inorganic phosphate transporter, PiT family